MNFLLCAVCGLINPVNNMVNVKAGQCLGTARGALVNYAGATVLSLLVVLLTGHGNQLAPAYIASVPWYLYLGSVCGLTALAIIIKATPKSGALVSSVCLIIGSMGMSMVLDYVFSGLFSWRKVLGILLVIGGVAWKQAVAEK